MGIFLYTGVSNGGGLHEQVMTRYLCELLNVSRSGYYNYLQAADARLERARLDAEAGEWIKKAFHRKGFKKGSRSIKMILENEFGIIYNLQRDFKKGIPGLALLTDITYLPYGRTEMAYLSTILDASTGEILYHNLSIRIELSIPIKEVIIQVQNTRSF